MTSNFERRLAKLEAEVMPAHRHQAVIECQPWDNADELIAQAEAECESVGCTLGIIVVPAVCDPLDWDKLVQRELEYIHHKTEE